MSTSCRVAGEPVLSPAGGGGSAAALNALGVHPRPWVQNVSDAGTASVGGEQTSHVTADVDVPRLMEDLIKVAERTGQAQQIPAQARDAIREAVKSAKLEVYASKADGYAAARRRDRHLRGAGPGASASPATSASTSR